MKRIIFFLTILNFPFFIFAQNIEVIENFQKKGNSIIPEKFEYIDKSYNIQDKDLIATIRGEILITKKSYLVKLFNSLWDKTNELGANSFLIDEFTSKSDKVIVKISVYNLTEKQLEENFDLYPKNMVYVHGDISKRQSPKKIKFNNEKLILKPMEYISYQNKVGEDAILSIGGFLGAKVWIRGKDDRLPVHLSLNGFGVGPGSYNEISISFNTGRIYPVELNFGQFLINILSKKR